MFICLHIVSDMLMHIQGKYFSSIFIVKLHKEYKGRQNALIDFCFFSDIQESSKKSGGGRECENREEALRRERKTAWRREETKKKDDLQHDKEDIQMFQLS